MKTIAHSELHFWLNILYYIWFFGHKKIIFGSGVLKSFRFQIFGVENGFEVKKYWDLIFWVEITELFLSLCVLLAVPLNPASSKKWERYG